MRLALYVGLGAGYFYSNRKINAYFTNSQYQDVTLRILTAQEVKKFRRAWQIKKAEADEEKKALAKYKYDPQSYH